VYFARNLSRRRVSDEGRSLARKVVVDIGAFLRRQLDSAGEDWARPCSLRASVAAGELLRRNLAANGVGDAVHFFNAGLSTHAHRETTGGEILNFVDGIPFCDSRTFRLRSICSRWIARAAEYPMFEDERFLDHLARPRS